MAFHIPERFFNRISEIDLDNDIINQGFKYVLLDVDNTILTRDNSIIPNDVKAWINQGRKKGLEFCLVSNDWHQNVIYAANEIKAPIVVRSLKPLPFAFLSAMKKIKADKKQTLMIGDQLTTDVFGAHLIGLPCYLVLPLVKKDLKHTLILRKLEKIILNGRRPEVVAIKEYNGK